MKTTSCTFLQKAIFLGTDEFRHCCYRFYVDGEMKGDVAVFPVETDQDASLDKVVAAKKNLIEKINNGEKTECSGCPLLERKDWMSIDDEKFNHLQSLIDKYKSPSLNHTLRMMSLYTSVDQFMCSVERAE